MKPRANTALILGASGQDRAFLAELLLKGRLRLASICSLVRIDHTSLVRSSSFGPVSFP